MYWSAPRRSWQPIFLTEDRDDRRRFPAQRPGCLIEEKTGITTMIAEDPLTAVAIGTGKFIEFAHGMNMAMEASMGVGGGREDY